jgi:antitoxin FitA
MRRRGALLACDDDKAYVAGKWEIPMATLTIRNVDPEVQKRLRVRAALNGRSMEAELRQILKDAVGASPAPKAESGLDLAEAIRRRFAPFGGVELDIPPREFAREPPDFQ